VRVLFPGDVILKAQEVYNLLKVWSNKLICYSIH